MRFPICTGTLLLAYAIFCAQGQAQELPQRIAPSAPFPKILTQAPTLSFIAPGVTEGEYDLQTAAGPIVVRAIAIDLQRSDLHIGAVLAQDKLVSQGETVRSMALRTSAVAGINGDYFDINNTNAPLNILIADSRLLHSPMQRYALGIDANNRVHFEEYGNPPNDLVTAIGGGPLLLRDGVVFNDTDGPNGAEFKQRIPASGVASNPENTLFLIEVDGNQPGYSIGVTRPEFAALMRAFGATDGMALDGGGSATLVARELGDPQVTLQNSPSDMRERPVGDGLFVYSDAPTGEPARIGAHPTTIRAVVGAIVPFRFAVTDAAGHLVTPESTIRTVIGSPDIGTVNSTYLTALKSGTTLLHVRSGSLSLEIPVTVVVSPARLAIRSDTMNFEPSQQAHFNAMAYDKNGYLLAVPLHLPWTADHGAIASDGAYTAGTGKATITLRIGTASATLPITVGHHEIPFAIGTHLAFSTAPRGGPGSVAFGDPTCPTCTQLLYDFSGSERAAYAHIEKPLPQGSIGFAFDVLGDSSNAIVRIKLTNAINESVLLTATQLTFTGWHHVVVRFPSTLLQPAKLSSIYTLNGLGTHHISTSGTLTVKNPRILLPGS